MSAIRSRFSGSNVLLVVLEPADERRRRERFLSEFGNAAEMDAAEAHDTELELADLVAQADLVIHDDDIEHIQRKVSDAIVGRVPGSAGLAR